MSREKEKIKLKCSMYEVDKRERKHWGINPVTRVVRDRTKYSRRKKHRGNDWSD